MATMNDGPQVRCSHTEHDVDRVSGRRRRGRIRGDNTRDGVDDLPWRRTRVATWRISSITRLLIESACDCINHFGKGMRGCIRDPAMVEVQLRLRSPTASLNLSATTTRLLPWRSRGLSQRDAFETALIMTFMLTLTDCCLLF